MTLKKAKKQSESFGGRQKSPMSYNNNSSTNIMNQMSSENGSTLKMYDQAEVAPAWYKSLKKNVTTK